MFWSYDKTFLNLEMESVTYQKCKILLLRTYKTLSRMYEIISHTYEILNRSNEIICRMNEIIC